MALPTLTKTWEYAVNQAGVTSEEALLLSIKENLIGNGPTAFSSPWSVVSSSDGVIADNTDRWSVNGDIIFHNPGSAHSWIVLENDAINTGFQILIEAIRNGGGGQDAWDLRVSEAVGFTGGTITNRPTAADEIDPVEGSSILSVANSENLVTDPARLHFTMSNDGQSTRWWVYVANVLLHYVDIQIPTNTPAGWTIPWVITVAVQYYATGASVVQCTYAKLWQDNPPGRVYSRAAGLESLLFYTQEASVGSGLTEEFLGIVQTVQNDLGGGFGIYPIGLFSKTVGSRGRIGELVDVWGGSVSVNDKDHYPADTSRQFVQLGDIVVPWGGFAQMITA